MMERGIPPNGIKDALMRVMEELPAEHLAAVLDFALFLQTRQAQARGSASETNQLGRPTPYPLRGTVLRYDDPFAPVAESDWEAAQ